jgi:short-subunit dehydrogenase
MINKQVVLVTGASSGIGLALVKEFYKKGFKVYGTTRQPDQINPELKQGLRFLELDVTNHSSQAQCIESIIKAENKIDVVVNNAGFGMMGPLADIPVDEIRRQFEVNFFGLVAINRLIIPQMIKQHSGKIVNLSSISGVMPTAFSGAYCASKAAVNAYSDALRIELKPFNIQVITVQPGRILSNFGKNAFKNLVFNKDNSAYAPISKYIEKRVLISQENATTAEEFARRLVKELVKSSPKAVSRIGKSSFLYAFMKRWIPDSILDMIISKTFGLNQLHQ